MKKTLLLLFLVFSLISCWTDGNNTSNLIEIDWWDFTIMWPSNWEVINKTDNRLPNIKIWEFELALMSQKPINSFSNNLLILSDELNKLTTSKDYSILNNVWAKQDYLEYTELSSKTITFSDEEESIMYIFEARYNLNTPKLKFIQSANICNKNKAFYFTIAIPTSIKDTSKYEALIKSFKCK